MQILILPSEQLWDGWHTLRSLLRTRASSEAGILRHNRNSRNQRDRNLKKKSSQKETGIEVFVCLIKACKAHVSTELQHLQQSRSKFVKLSHNPFRELNQWSGWKPNQGCLHKSGVIMPYCCPTEGYHWNLLFFTEAGDQTTFLLAVAG